MQLDVEVIDVVQRVLVGSLLELSHLLKKHTLILIN